IPLKEKMFFVEHLAVMMKASIPLDRALSTLAEQTTNKGFRHILQSIFEKVSKGETLSSGLSQFQSVFGGFFVNMIQAGEYSGKLEEGLRRLYVQMKKDYELRSKVKSALTYPIFVIIAMIGIGGAIMFFVVPKLIPLFEGFGAQLPLATRILIAISNFLSKYAFFVALGTIAGVITLIKLLRGPLRRSWHGLLLHIPILSGLIKRVNIARFARTLSTLLSTDLLVVEALTITSKILGNEHYKSAIAASAEKIKQGIPIATAIKEYPFLFPATLHTMVQVGEESGTLVDLLNEVAEFYEESVDDTTKSISSIIEPALIILLGGAVGGIALAILMPMYTLMDQI
ncbi:MAG: type II secretion system F family protein, partial [bacterium]|nr:type II secretion system F family protein [bacterium]